MHQAATAVEKLLNDPHRLAHLEAATNMSWRGGGEGYSSIYEGEVAPLQRFLADVPVSAGAWMYIHSVEENSKCGHSDALQLTTPDKKHPSTTTTTTTTTTCSSSSSSQQHVPATHIVDSSSKISKCDIEIDASWSSLVCLTPDATQLANPHWSPLKDVNIAVDISNDDDRLREATEAAKRGDIAPLRLMIVDAVLGTCDGVDRAPIPAQDPIVAISCITTTFTGSAAAGDHRRGGGEGEGGEDEDDENNADEEEEGNGGGTKTTAIALSSAAVAGAPSRPSASKAAPLGSSSKEQQHHPRTYTFVWNPTLSTSSPPTTIEEQGTHIAVFKEEADLLSSFISFLNTYDPDILVTFQVGDTLDRIKKRSEALGVGGNSGSNGLLFGVGRLVGRHANAAIVKKVTMYSAAWVKSQSRMASTSNQETYAMTIDGVLVIDILRQVLTGSTLSSFSLVDCVQTLLGQTLEVIRPNHIMSHLVNNNNGKEKEGGTLRLARYSNQRCRMIHALLDQLATIPEGFEMARATGLTINQVFYNAQMIRTLSLLLREAGRRGFILSGRQDALALSESPFLIHPVEQNTVGLYKDPVAVLDFASLYPSLYRAYNLCYTTLLHPDDVGRFSKEDIFVSPQTGAAFVKSRTRSGVLPDILAALMNARASTREQLKHTTDTAMRAVLDGRQRALKVTANALYGFTGAGASPLQCAPLANSCLALGAQSCRQAKQVLEAAAQNGSLGLTGRQAKVVYAQTDSLFVVLPLAKSPGEAIKVGKLASSVVSQAFPDPIELKFQNIMQPFLLLQVNRYAGRAFSTIEAAEIQGGCGELVVKGLKSMWRQAAPIVRTTLHGALVCIIMHNDVQLALEFCTKEIKRLLLGEVDLFELIMTGGLWRISGEQIDKAAAAAAAAASGSGGGSGVGGVGVGGVGGGGGNISNTGASEEVKGPHASLAVRLAQRDPGCSFVLGQRLQYVLVSGRGKLQDDAAEDPLTVLRQGLIPDYQLYWRNKLKPPLQELLTHCVTDSQLQQLVHGGHTMVKVDFLSQQQQEQQVLMSQKKQQSEEKEQQRKILTAMPPISPSPSSSKKKKKTTRSATTLAATAATPAAKSTQVNIKQTGLTSFFKSTAKCLSCKRGLPGTIAGDAFAPGLCPTCSSLPDKFQETYLDVLEDLRFQEARQCGAHDACRSCGSSTVCQPVVCENAECPVFYKRQDTDVKTVVFKQSLDRLM